MAVRLSLGEMLGAGSRAVGRYTGTLLSVFLVQTLLAVAVMAGVSIALSMTFARLPLWDDAVDGDLVALMWCLRDGKASLLATAGIVLGGLFMWQLATWFLVGGIHGVFSNRPEGRGETARCFGAAGASTYLAYVRLALCAVPLYIVVAFVLMTGVGIAAPRIEYALTIPQVLAPLAIAILPALLLLHVVWTIIDYARVELTLRGESHAPGSLMTFGRACAFVLKRPLSLVHGALGWIVFIAISVGYAYLAHGHPMYGAEGAITLFVIRQGVALARTAVRFGMLAGQLELGKTRALPPRRVEPKSEPTNA